MATDEAASEMEGMTYRMIQYLEANPRAPFSEIARAIGANESLVRRRVTRLVEDGRLTFFAAVDQSRFAASSNSLILVDVHQGKFEEVTDELLGMPEVHYLGVGTGSPDLIASVIFASDKELGNFLRGRLQRVTGIQSVRTLRVLEVLLRRPEWPVMRR
jgi:DNA-binding Lrp family transcriptional regulator